MADWKLIRKLANEVRKWAEHIQKTTDDEYGYDEDLCGLCAIASARLHFRLKQHNIESTIIHGWAHVFLVIEGVVVDVTATQFAWTVEDITGRPVPKILIINWADIDVDENNTGPWSQLHEFPTIKQLIDCQRKTGWPMEQTPKYKMVTAK